MRKQPPRYIDEQYLGRMNVSAHPRTRSNVVRVARRESSAAGLTRTAGTQDNGTPALHTNYIESTSICF